ncbi:hypothetical protein AMTRI_Chr04g180420 [Amborella trichopoda]|uniref:BING4 C-terminal domain-containing protein n=1 Tax=Amborella trichopoda TaxID=13333 RepID=W1PMH4_AMBTC|nr:probable U3 small nucleolar RNA-associated protein 7 [Amborella trichopoda]ERN11202.1 hypothetical protein AMTR_s00024p00216120 [Amborella trichopoda]|eukprot:XP_006849621.1 probable U3 small nucleolar RNA-associated protein 7 [Amborella trichopoda]
MALSDEEDLDIKKYLRGENKGLKAVKDKKLRGQLTVREELYSQSAKAAAKVEKWLLPSEGGYLETEGLEKSWRIKQENIVHEVDILSSRKAFDIVLPDLGPYVLDYTSNGHYMLVGGRRGHLAMMDVMSMNLIKEFQVRETIRDVKFLHNDQFFAAAQKKYSYIYNKVGTEIHCLKENLFPLSLQFLQNYFLLVSINKYGQLLYQDTTTGEIVGHHRTGLGRCDVMNANPFNSVIALGHNSGKVTLWKPTSANPLVKMLCHHGPIAALAFHNNGHLMATAGMDHKIKLWDLRKFEAVHTFKGHAKTLDFSQRGLLAMASGSLIKIWRDDSGNSDYQLYMSHRMLKGYQVGEVRFRPYEDVLGFGHSTGISSILVPGSGEPNFDTFVANPFETSKQRREKEVHALLDKLQPEMIMMDQTKIGGLKSGSRAEEGKSKEGREAEMDAALAAAKGEKRKKKTKGRSKPSKIEKKKKETVIKAKRPFIEERVKEEEKRKKQKVSEMQLPLALQRFARSS